MNVARTEGSTPAAAKPGEEGGEGEGVLAGVQPSEILASARTRVSALVTAHPAATLLGAFAIGFAVARLVRALGDD